MGHQNKGDESHGLSHDEWLESRFPREVLNALSPEQRTALGTVMRESSWKSHPVDLRFSFPLLAQRYFLTIVGGRERRSNERLKAERRARPVRTVGNILFILGIAVFFYMVAVMGIFVYADILEL